MNKVITILALALASITSFAQAPSWAWAKSAGGTGAEEGYSIATDASGNVLVTGQFSSPTITFGTTTLTNEGGSDIFVVKYDAIGHVLWAKSVGGSTNDKGFGIATDKAGNVLITGYYQSPTITFGTTTLTNSGNSDVFIVKYDASGNVLWAKSAGGTASDESMSVSADAFGNVLITGYFVSPTISFGTIALTNAVIGNDVFIAKYDASGNVLWAKSAGGTSNDGGQSVTTDAGGNVLITGVFSSSIITFDTTRLINTDKSGNGTDLFIVKYDPSGNLLWAKSTGGTSSDWGYSISTDSNSNILIAGSFYSRSISFGTTTLTNADKTGNNTDVFIAKYDSLGNVLWAKSVGGTYVEYGFCVYTNTDGTVLVTGVFSSSTITVGTITLTNEGFGNVFIVKYDASGNELWAKSAGGAIYDVGYSISTDASGNVLIAGKFLSPSISFGTTIITNADTTGNSADFFVAKLSPSTGIAEMPFKENIAIYPNPFSTQTNIVFSEEQRNTSIKIVDVLGKEVRKVNFTGKKLYIDRGEMNAGIYFLQITDEKKNHASKKIIVQ